LRNALCVLLLAGSAACAGARPSPLAPDARHEAPTPSPAAFCARVAALAARKDPTLRFPCDCFTPLYAAMRDDDDASYRCEARCADESDDLDALQACLDRRQCARLTAPPNPRTPDPDARIESYCARITAIDDPADGDRLGMATCTLLAHWSEQQSAAGFDCAYACAMASTSEQGYQACVDRRGCQGGVR